MAFFLFPLNKIVKVLLRRVVKDPPQLPNTDKLNSFRSYSKGRMHFVKSMDGRQGVLCTVWSPPITATADVNFLPN